MADAVYERFVVVDCYGNEWIEDFVRKAEEFFGEPPIPYWPIRPRARIRELFRELSGGELLQLLAFISKGDEDFERELNEVLEGVGVRLEGGVVVEAARSRLGPLEEVIVSSLETLGLDDVSRGFRSAFMHLRGGEARDAHANVRSSLRLLLVKTVPSPKPSMYLRKAELGELVAVALERGVIEEPAKQLFEWFVALPRHPRVGEELDLLATYVGAALALYLLRRVGRDRPSAGC